MGDITLTTGPHIHSKCVLGRSQENLWGTVPAGGYVICEDGVVPVAGIQLRYAACKAEVSQLDQAVAVEQKVARLRVSNRRGCWCQSKQGQEVAFTGLVHVKNRTLHWG